MCFLSGTYGFEQSNRKAIDWFELAAERGDRFAMVNLATCLLDGVGVFWKNTSKAQALLEQALAAEGEWYPGLTPPEAYFEALRADDSGAISDRYEPSMQERSEGIANFRLGQIYQEQDELSKAHLCFSRAAMVGDRGRGGVYPAAVRTAVNLAFGKGVGRDMEAAHRMLAHSKTLLREQVTAMAGGLMDMRTIDRFSLRATREEATKASEAAEIGIQMEIGRVFGDPKSKDFDAEQAVLWFELAAEGGNAWAAVRLGELYSDPTLPIHDPAKAFQWYAHGHEHKSHILLTSNYAISLFHGIGTAPDRDAAEAVFRERKDVDIVCYLGTRGLCPDKIVTYEERQDLIKAWAKSGDVHAQYLYGRIFYYGWGVKESNSSAYRWFSKAAKAGHAEAHFFLGEIHWYGHGRRQNLSKANEHYRRAAGFGSARGAFKIAHNTTRGVGMKADPSQSEKLYGRVLAIDPEHSAALNNLGVYYEKRIREALRDAPKGATTDEVEVLRERMLSFAEQSSELGDGLASSNLGHLYFAGDLVPQDYRKALRYLTTAIDQGEARAYFLLGRIFDEGLGVGRNVDEAAHYFRLAGINHPDRETRKKALARLCNYYLSGESGSIDLKRAIHWMALLDHNGAGRVLGPFGDALLQLGEYRVARQVFKRGAKNADAYLSGYSYDRLSKIYEQGLGVRANPRRAKRYLERAIGLGFADSLFTAALDRHRLGDFPGAVAGFREAHASGSRDAAYLLARYSLTGEHMPRDQQAAIELLREAATLNHVDALYDLAVMSFQRIDGAPSLTEAIEFARRAELFGHEKAGALRETLEKRLQEEDRRGGGGRSRDLTRVGHTPQLFSPPAAARL